MTESIFLSAAIIGFMQLVKCIFNKDWKSVVIIVGVVLIGGVAGSFGIEGLSISSGITLSLSAAGIYRVGQVVSGE